MSRIIGIDLGMYTSEISCVIDGTPVVMPNTNLAAIYTS